MKWLLLDITNLLYRTFYVQTGEDDRTLAGLATHMALTMMNKYYKQFKPDKVVMAFDRSSWRKMYTASEVCISKRPYKGNRRQSMSPSQEAKYALFLEHVAEFERLIIQHTTVITLYNEALEADDVIAGFIQAHPEDDITLVSTDTDMLQLLIYPNLTIISPTDGKPVQLSSEYNNDPEFYLFVKCIRGDSTDNVQSAYPRVHLKRLAEAYKDPYKMVQLMKETWTNERGEIMKVEELYEENQMLIDLRQQPDNIRKRIEETVSSAISSPRKFSYFHLMKFIGKYELNKIGDNIDQYLPMLSR